MVGGLWQSLDNPVTRPAGTANDVALTVYNNALHLVVAHGTTPFFTPYILVGESWRRLADPDVPPTGTGNGAACCVHNGTLYTAVAHSNTPFITTYSDK